MPDAPELDVRVAANLAVAEVRVGRAHLLALGQGSAVVGTVFVVPGTVAVSRHRADVRRLMVLKVWITDAPVLTGRAGWHVFDDGRHLDLGELKGNVGSSNYVLPVTVDLAELTSVSIWCDRFNVSFGAATLTLSTL